MQIFDSQYISILAARINVDFCNGNFLIDFSPSIFTNDGENNVLGAKVKIEDDFGVEVKAFPISDYDIEPPMDGTVTVPIPELDNEYKQGDYKITIELYETLTKKYTLEITVNVCAVGAEGKKFGVIGATIEALCKDGMAYIRIDEVPAFKGKLAEQKQQEYKLDYPAGSGLPAEVVETNSFSAHLFDGEYKLEGEVCALYNMGNNIYYSVNYKIKKRKKLSCAIDSCCVLQELARLQLELENNNCSLERKEVVTNIIIDALLLLKTIDLAAACGQDASDYIDRIEALLEMNCRCGYSEGSPITAVPTPAALVVIQGCNVSEQQVGLATHYTINNYQYIVQTNPNQNYITISSPVLDGCDKKQILNFNIQAVHAGVLAIANQGTNALEWASMLDSIIKDLDPTCMGYTTQQWQNMTFAQHIQAIMNIKCGGGSGGCQATVTDVAVNLVGGVAVMSWSGNNAYAYQIFIDGNLYSQTINEQINIVGFSDLVKHTYEVIPLCKDGQGTPVTGFFVIPNCPFIVPPVLTANSNLAAACPFNLFSVMDGSVPYGTTIEWHTQNNVNANTLVENPAAATTGEYYAFHVNADGCASSGTKFVLVCATGGTCTAPINPTITETIGGALVRFSSSAIQPIPANNYVVKRKLASAPNVGGSYTTLGTPVFDSMTNKWQLLDNTAAINTLYTYAIEANCGDGNVMTSYIDYIKNVCPEATIETTIDSLSISYPAPVYGSVVVGHQIKLYQGGVQIGATVNKSIPLADPVEHTFSGLIAGGTYNVVTTTFFETTNPNASVDQLYSKSCAYNGNTLPLTSCDLAEEDIEITNATLVGFDVAILNLKSIANGDVCDETANVKIYETSNLTLALAETNLFAGDVFTYDASGDSTECKVVVTKFCCNGGTQEAETITMTLTP